ncbi:hypothetical protein GGI07_001808 [Coemansia sp. Benny D115]|nr:hypothetical protein GGI07_001808 [Coemansia sp. Benny D115]
MLSNSIPLENTTPSGIAAPSKHSSHYGQDDEDNLTETTSHQSAATTHSVHQTTSKYDTEEGDEEREKEGGGEEQALPYSHFSSKKRTMIVTITALTGLVSPLASNMYYPSIQHIRDDLHTTQSGITWTVTSFIIAMAVFPLVWSNLADQIGRKPVYVMSMLTFVCGSIGCALSNNLAALIASRVIQSAGSSAVQGAGAGTISDIYPREKRGTALGIYYLGPLLGPCLGPLIGGYVGEGVGWRWVFWILAIWGGIMMLLALLVLPETHRRIVVDRGHRIALVNIPRPLGIRENNPLLDIATVRYPVVALAMLHFAMIFGAYFTNATGQPLAYENVYGLSQGMAGICFLSSGVGCITGSISGGRVTDMLLARAKRQALLAREAEQPQTGADAEAKAESEAKAAAEIKVPAETRLGAMWIGSVLFLAALLISGWLIDRELSLAGVLVMQFFVGAGMAFTFQGLGGYVIDVFPTMSARITGVQNFWRSVWAAVIVQLFPTMLRNIGWGWSYTIMFFLTLMSLTLIQLLVVFRGERLRARFGPKSA